MGYLKSWWLLTKKGLKVLWDLLILIAEASSENEKRRLQNPDQYCGFNDPFKPF